MSSPTTGSFDSSVNTTGPPMVGPAGGVSVSTGAVRSDVMSSVAPNARLFALLAAEFSGISTLTGPSPAGVRVNVQVRASTCAKSLTAPPLAMRSASSNPWTGLLNSTLTGIVAWFVGFPAVVVIATVGRELSNSRVSRLLATEPLPTASSPAESGTFTVTSPSLAGTMSTVYDVPAPLKLIGVPLVTSRSSTTNPVTASENVIDTAIGEVPVAAGAGESTTTVGRVAS